MKTIKLLLMATVSFGYVALAGPGMSSESPKLQIPQKRLHGMLISAIQEHDHNRVVLILGHLKKKTINNGDKTSLSPLHYAIILDNKQSKLYIVKSLIDAGAKPHNIDGYGYTPHDLAESYHRKVSSYHDSTESQKEITAAVLKLVNTK